MKPSARMHRSVRIGGGGGTSRPYDGKIAGLYDLEDTLGQGHFAVVKLARHVFTGEKVAVKVIDKSKLDEISKAHLFQEVRCMKLVQHPNVVRLYEVIDTATKLYLILELGDGGDLYEYILRHDTGLPEQTAKEYFSQIVRAISYCHQLHVVHRDLKPENVVFFKKLGVVKLTDFGFSNKFYPGQKLETSCGSLAYSAPEILLGDSYDAPAVDVWSLGVILYMLVCGQPPFQEANDSETLTMIMDCKYIVPPHVSKECRDLIARMLVRNPEKRATLHDISRHAWLAQGGKKDLTPSTDMLPLVSREHLSEEDHNLIVQKIVNGNIATKEEIQECLDKNEYNHITATYYLLAERKLRSKRQDQVNKNKRPEHLPVTNSIVPTPKRDNNGTGPNPNCLLTVPRTPGDVPQRTRKCSIVQEDEEEEDITTCAGGEELGPPLNRRGSRSEGRLNLALQERLADSERRKPPHPPITPNIMSLSETEKLKPLSQTAPQHKPQMGKSNSLSDSTASSPVQVRIIKEMSPKPGDVTTTIITDCSTITIPIITTSTPAVCPVIPKYKTMPSPTRSTNLSAPSPVQLNEIFEEGDAGDAVRSANRQFVSRTQNRTPYEQRRSKFHKSRTASCSSSDASDDDSEKRKKRAHKLNTSSKPFQGRRDSHDDSSDSQEPGTGGGGGGGGGSRITTEVPVQNNNQETPKSNGNTTNTSGSGNRQNCGNTGIMLGRRHKASRRRNGETRLRESQSLNRITEVQEDAGAHALVIATTVVGTQGGVVPPKVRGIGARLLQGFTLSSRKPPAHVSRKDTVKNCDLEDITPEDVSKSTISSPTVEETTQKLLSNSTGSNSKKIRLFGKYFQVHKKLCIPLLFSTNNKNRLYKAQSCGSLTRDKISTNATVSADTMLRCRHRAVSVIRNTVGSDGDINQNQNEKVRRKSSSAATVVQLNNVCNELTGICAIHLGQASKCCSFC